MKGPIVSIDVSKGKSDYQAFKDLNVKYTGSRSIKHTKEGFDEIVNLVREMEKKLETGVCVVYEATGVYHRVLKKVLEDNNIKQFIHLNHPEKKALFLQGFSACNKNHEKLLIFLKMLLDFYYPILLEKSVALF